MKRNIFIYLIIFLTFSFLIINQKEISTATINTSMLFLSKVLPNIFPMFILSKLLLNYNFPYYIAKIFNNHLYFYLLSMSFLSGSPINTLFIKDLLNNNLIDEMEGNHYLTCTNFNSPLFLFSMLSSYLPLNITILLIIIPILSNIIIYFRHPFKNVNIKKIKSHKVSIVLISSIKEAINTLLLIYLSMILCSYLIIVIPNSFEFIKGIIEITQGLNYLYDSNLIIVKKILLSIIYISFQGLSIHLQTKSIISDTKLDYMRFFKSRFIHILISIILFIVIYQVYVLLV